MLRVASLPKPVIAALSAAIRGGAALAGVKMPVVDGFTLDPEIAFGLWLDRMRAPKPLGELPLDEARRVARHRAAPYVPVPVGHVAVHEAALACRAGIRRVRLFHPAAAPVPAPAIVWYHGGGWTIGGLDADDGFCRWLADRTRCVVVAVEYRLGPEHRFPAAHEDAIDAWNAIVAHADAWSLRPNAIAVAGSSAGGNLAAWVSIAARDMGATRPAAQLLFYPATDLRRGAPSHRTVGDRFVLDKALMDWFLASYIAPESHVDPRASVLLTPDLSGLPPATVVTAGFDPLRDEGRMFAERLRAAGNDVEYICAERLIHGFAEASGGSSEARRFTTRVVDGLAARLYERVAERDRPATRTHGKAIS